MYRGIRGARHCRSACRNVPLGMHTELCDRSCGASRGRADSYNARERKYRGGRRRRGRVQPCPLPLSAGEREGDRVDIPRHGNRTCRRHGICGSCGDTVRYGFRRDTYTYRSQFRRGQLLRPHTADNDSRKSRLRRTFRRSVPDVSEGFLPRKGENDEYGNALRASVPCDAAR